MDAAIHIHVLYPPSPQLPGLGDAAGLRADFKG